MTKQSLDERIEAYVSEHQYIDGDTRPVPQNEYIDEFKQLIRDVLTEVLPEKLPKPTIGDDICERYYNHAIDQFDTNLNNLLGEKQ